MEPDDENPSGRSWHAALTDSVTETGAYAFAGCRLLNITIPHGVTDIGHGAFGSCISLTSLTIPESMVWTRLSSDYRDANWEWCIRQLQPVDLGTAPARLFCPLLGACRMVAKDCGCGQCENEQFLFRSSTS